MTEDVTLHEEAIIAALRDLANVANADVYRYLEYQSGSDYLPTDFFKDGDLESYRAACAWWPTPKNPDDMPWTVRKPLLEQLCFNYAADPRETFMQRLSAWAQRADNWAKANVKPLGRPRVHQALPGETEDERERRLNRERQDRHRLRNTGKPKTEQELAASASYNALQAARAAKRQAMKEWDAHLAMLEAVWAQLRAEAMK